MEPWKDRNSIWKTKSEYYVWLRGALRRIWSDYPLRKQWRKEALRLVTTEERAKKIFHPSTKNVGQCSYCNNWFAGSKLEVDHKIPSEGCYDHETATKFLWYCAGQGSDAFQLVCKPCHKIKTYAERMNFTFEEADLHKQAIAFSKQPKSVQETFFKERGTTLPTNTKKRREAFIEAIRED